MRRQPAARCECGAKRHPNAEACRRCSTLDGRSVAETRLVHALRLAAEPVDVTQLAGLAAITPRNVIRAIKPLVTRGRVIRRAGEQGERTMYSLRSD